MCHSNFHLTLNPRVNFISGLNGSGKSAIQTAIVVGFGARASITNRGNSLKSLIKYGCSSATVSITIANGGDESFGCGSFKPQVYGKQITIERKITESGFSPHKFFNDKGRVVKVDKNELKNLVLHFNILVDNPICVMNQQMVKTFHKSENPKNKYELFYKAISADVYADNISQTNLIARNNLEKLENTKIVLNQCFKEVSEFETYELKCKQLETLKIKKTQYENEYSWCIIFKHQRLYKEYLNQIEELKNKMLQNSEKIKLLEENIITCSEVLNLKKNELENVESARSHNHFILMKSKTELKIKNHELDQVNQAAHRYETSAKMLIRDKKELIRQMEAEHKKGNTNTLAQYREMLAQYEQNFTEIEAGWKTNIEHEQTLRNTIDNLKEKIGNLKDKVVTPLQKRIYEVDRNINSMSQQEDTIHFYGTWMQKLIQTVENAFKQNKFIKKPIGPIGTYIKVNNNKWIFSIENYFGRGLLRTFLVDNFTDNKVLRLLMDRVIPENVRRPAIITSKFFDKIHDISTSETKNNMFHMLTFTNPVVANCLIDNNKIETIMLINDTMEALPIMENASKVPRNCRFSLTLDSTQVFPNPSYRVYSLQNPCKPVFLQSDVSIAINNLKHEKQELEEKIGNLNQEYENSERSKLEKQQHLNKTQSETRLLKAKYDEYLKKINALKTKIEEEQDDRIGTITGEMNIIDTKIAEAEKSKEEFSRPILKYEKEISELKENIENIKLTIDKIDHPMILEEIDTLEQQINMYKIEKSQIDNSLEEIKQVLNDKIMKSENEKNILDSKVEVANQLSEKMEINRSEDDIKRLLEVTKSKYRLLNEELKKRGENHLVLREEYKNRKEKYIHQSELYEQVDEIFRANDRSIKLSVLVLKNYIESIRLKIIESFETVLGLRSMKGQLQINMNEQSMIITMFDNISTSCASGGERTFATVALILALWCNMQLPFYSIDEYDVYMDNVNRLATTQMLMMAIGNRRNQFIFLTPQDISHIKSTEKIKIVKLKEPRS